MKSISLALCVSLALFMHGATSDAIAASKRDKKAETPAPAAGFQFFCIHNDCSASGPATIPLTEKLMADLKKVNGDVNRSIRYVPEKVEKWSLGVKAGDCDDFVMAKRDQLIRMGYPSAALRFATGRVPFGPKHAVLVVATDKGFKTLDNRHGRIVPLSRSGLTKIKMSSADPKVWFYYP